MRGVVGPGAVSTQAAVMAGIEIVPVNEAVVDDHAVVAPAGMPSPAAPATPPPAEIEPHRDPNSKSKVTALSERRIKPIRIGIIEGRAPDIGRIVIWQVHNLRIGWLDVDDGLSGVVRGRHSLLTC